MQETSENSDRLTVKAVTTTSIGFTVVILDDSLPADRFCHVTDIWIGVIVAYLSYFKTPRKVGGHDFTACFVEDWFVNSGIRRAKGLPVAEGSVQG